MVDDSPSARSTTSDLTRQVQAVPDFRWRARDAGKHHLVGIGDTHVVRLRLPAPSVPADNPAKAVTLLSTGARTRSVSRIVAPRVVVANPVAKPCTARATTSAPAEPAVMNMSMATTFIAKALRMAGRRPM